jgi:hypothetical protein
MKLTTLASYRAKVKVVWSCVAVVPFVFMSWCSAKQKLSSLHISLLSTGTTLHLPFTILHEICPRQKILVMSKKAFSPTINKINVERKKEK